MLTVILLIILTSLPVLLYFAWYIFTVLDGIIEELEQEGK